MEKKDKYMSDFLFSTPNFWIGTGSVINLAGNYYDFNSSPSEGEADDAAIESDFRVIGQDILNAVRREKSKSVDLTPAE